MLALVAVLIESSIVLSLYVAIGALLYTMARLADSEIREPRLSQLLSWPITMLLDLVVPHRPSQRR
jgi:hypothetical protein